ncbi:MAG TPA: DUF1003 domain-containing protein [Vicinamibacterales bacterium]|jgi:uncharacterized membrane protein|nr:DUF1003 domain-containing protein [Vicinamibacterales bacterium]
MSQRQPNPAARNVEDIARLEREALKEVPAATRVIVSITNAIGTPASALLHAMAFAAWTAWNGLAPATGRFDPFPYPLLTMLVSMEGVVLAVLILTTQNRMSVQTERRDQLDLQVNLLAEQEMTMVLRLLHRIAEHIGVARDAAEHDQTRELMEHTNIYQLMETLEKKFK